MKKKRDVIAKRMLEEIEEKGRLGYSKTEKELGM
jgi:hypothetical protein